MYTSHFHIAREMFTVFVLGPYTDLPAEIRELAHFHEACSPLQERHSVI